MDEQTMNILMALQELQEDETVPRNIKLRLEEAANILQEESEELKLKVDKVLHLLDEITDDSNVKPYTRSQLWNIVSMLECVE